MKQFKPSSTSYEKPSDIQISPELKEVQSMMPMSQEDYQRLKASIEKDGLRENLKGYQDKTGTFYLLSGWNRLEIAKELGWKTVPIDVIEGPESQEERKLYAISENLDRRHLTSEQKRELVRFYLRLNPEESDREVSKKTGVSHPTVSKLREEEISRGKIFHVEKKDSLGRKVGKKKLPKTSQNQSSKTSRSSLVILPKERLKDLKNEKKRLEGELKRIEKEIKTLESKVKKT